MVYGQRKFYGMLFLVLSEVYHPLLVDQSRLTSLLMELETTNKQPLYFCVSRPDKIYMEVKM